MQLLDSAKEIEEEKKQESAMVVDEKVEKRETVAEPAVINTNAEKQEETKEINTTSVETPKPTSAML